MSKRMLLAAIISYAALGAAFNDALSRANREAHAVPHTEILAPETQPKLQTVPALNMSIDFTASPYLVHNAPRPPRRPTQARTFERDKLCLANLIFHEARGEDRQWRIAVAYVAVNRKNHPSRWPDTICGVVHQKNSKGVAQFSFVADQPWVDMDDDAEAASYLDALEIAEGVLTGSLPDNSRGATHYYVFQGKSKVNPIWAPKLTHLFYGGDHRFMQGL